MSLYEIPRVLLSSLGVPLREKSVKICSSLLLVFSLTCFFLRALSYSTCLSIFLDTPPVYTPPLSQNPCPSSSSTAEGSNHTDLKPSTYYRWSDVHQSVRESVDFPTPREELPSTQMDTTYPQTHI